MASVPESASPGKARTDSFDVVLPGQLPTADSLLALADSENFTVAARVLPRRIRRHLMAVYGYARLVDFAGDEAYGSREALLDLLESDLKRIYHGTPRIPLLRAMAPTVQQCDVPRETLQRLIDANRQDQRVHRYATTEELLDYCTLSANPIGELVLRIFGRARPENIALSDQVCTALQLLEHCQDLAEDFGKGRIYLPTADLERFSCTEQDLIAPRASPELRALVWFEVTRAGEMLDGAARLVSHLDGLARLAVAGYVAGGRATVRAFADAGHDPLRTEVRPNRLRVVGEWARLSVSSPRPPQPADRVLSAYRHCEEITRTQARNFSYGIRLLPGPKRRAMSAIYAFARRIDDIGDGDLPPEDKLRRLEQAREDVHSISTGASDPVLVALADTDRRMPIDLKAFDDLIDGCEADVRDTRYDTFDELLGYCRCVAGSVGRLSLGVFGCADHASAEPQADALGVALQLTNILRDVLEDRRADRIYLPRQDLEKFGVHLDLDADGMLTDGSANLAGLVRFEARRAQQWYRQGLQLLPMLDHRSRACCASMAGIYRELLQTIATSPRSAMRQRMSLSTPRKAGVALRSLAGVTP